MAEVGFPKRPAQHVSEDESLRLFQRLLPKQWIIRSQQASDYGIDAEVEIVMPDGEVRGDLVKVQLKGRESIALDGEGRASIGGIRQTTLNYWLNLAKRISVFAVATDHQKGCAYFTPVFWQATKLLDGTEATKSIRFPARPVFGSDDKIDAAAAPVVFFGMAQDRVDRRIEAHDRLLKLLPAVLENMMWAFQADMWCNDENPEVFEEYLQIGRRICPPVLENGDEAWFDIEYWRAESERVWKDHLMYGTMRVAYEKTMPLVCASARQLSINVASGEYYWSREAPSYLERARSVRLPEHTNIDAIHRFVDEHGMRR